MRPSVERKLDGDPRIAAVPDIHGHAKGEHKPYAEERPIPYTARMLFLWFFHACRRSSPRFVMVADHMNYLTFEDPAAVNLVRRALKLAQAGDLYGAAETAGVELGHAAVVSEGLRRGMRYSIGAEIDNDPRCRPDAQNIVDAMKPDGMIRSVHFLPITHPQHGENWMWAFDNPEFKDLYEVVGTENVWEIYMATLLEAIDKLPGQIVGHFYVPAKFGHWPADDVLDAYEDRFLAACAERGMAFEVNSRYFYKYFAEDDAQRERFRAVHLRLLRKAKERGVMVAVGSDAHSPKDQGAAFDVVLALLDEAEINEIAFPIGGRLARVALRATEEILREHTAALAAPPARAAVRGLVADDDEDENDAADDTATGDTVAPAASASSLEPAPLDTPAAPVQAPAPKAPKRSKKSALDVAAGAVQTVADSVVALVEQAAHGAQAALNGNSAGQPSDAPPSAEPVTRAVVATAAAATGALATVVATRAARAHKSHADDAPTKSSRSSKSPVKPAAAAKTPKASGPAEAKSPRATSTSKKAPAAATPAGAKAGPARPSAGTRRAPTPSARPLRTPAVKAAAAKASAGKPSASKASAAKTSAGKASATKTSPSKAASGKAASGKAATKKSPVAKSPKSAAKKSATRPVAKAKAASRATVSTSRAKKAPVKKTAAKTKSRARR